MNTLSTLFSFNGLPSLEPGMQTLRNASLPHLDPLYSFAAFRLEPDWGKYLRATYGAESNLMITELAEAAWCDLPAILAFAAMLNSAVVEASPSTSRASTDKMVNRRRAALLDHIEVRLALSSVQGLGQGQLARSRAYPRLHYVRGHYVHRGTTWYWRGPHLRGQNSSNPLQRTVTLTKPGPLRREIGS